MPSLSVCVEGEKKTAKSIETSAASVWPFMNHPEIKPSVDIDWLIVCLKPFLAVIAKHNRNMSCSDSSRLPNITTWKSLLSFIPQIRAIDVMNIFTDDPNFLNYGAGGSPCPPGPDYSFRRQGDKDSKLLYCSKLDNFVPLFKFLCETLKENVDDTCIGDP